MKKIIYKKNLLIIIMLISFLVLSTIPANAFYNINKKVETNDFLTNDEDLIKISTAILVDDKTYEIGNFGATKAFFRCLGDYSWKVGNITYEFKPKYFKMKDLIRGKLKTKDYDVLIYPPNTADEFLLKTGLKNLPKNIIWKKRINEFVRDGGGYFGACGGALIAGGMSNKPDTFLERAMKNSQLGISTVNFELNMSIPILNQIIGKDPSNVDTQAYLFFFGWGGSNTPHLSFSGASLDCPVLKDNPIFEDYFESTRKIRWIGSPGFEIPENPDREINLLVKFPNEEVSNNESLKIYHWKYVGGLRGLIKGLFLGIGKEVVWCENIPLMEAFLFSSDWVKTNKIVKTNLKNKAFITSEIYPNENKARIIRSSGHPELICWKNGEIVEANDTDDNNVYKGFHYYKDIELFEETIEDENKYNDWIIRRCIAWVSKKVPDNHLPSVYGPSEVVDFESYNQTSNFTVYGNAEISNGITSLDLYYKYSSNNYLWSNKILYGKDDNILDGWSWDFDAFKTNGTGYYQFYSIRNVKLQYNEEKETEPPGPDAVVYVRE